MGPLIEEAELGANRCVSEVTGKGANAASIMRPFNETAHVRFYPIFPDRPDSEPSCRVRRLLQAETMTAFREAVSIQARVPLPPPPPSAGLIRRDDSLGLCLPPSDRPQLLLQRFGASGAKQARSITPSRVVDFFIFRENVLFPASVFLSTSETP